MKKKLKILIFFKCFLYIYKILNKNKTYFKPSTKPAAKATTFLFKNNIK